MGQITILVYGSNVCCASEAIHLACRTDRKAQTPTNVLRCGRSELSLAFHFNTVGWLLAMLQPSNRFNHSQAYFALTPPRLPCKIAKNPHADRSSLGGKNTTNICKHAAMTTDRTINGIFNSKVLEGLLPASRSDAFFEALYGDPSEGAYDISLGFNGFDPEAGVLQFELRLKERPGKCLRCNLTYGLPEVFSRHPLIDIKGMVAKIDQLLGDLGNCGEWSLGRTNSVSDSLHTVPLTVKMC